MTVKITKSSSELSHGVADGASAGRMAAGGRAAASGAGAGGRGVAPRARPVARSRASDPRQHRQLQDAVAAPPRRVQDHGRRRKAGGYAAVASPDAADAPEPARLKPPRLRLQSTSRAAT